MPGDATGTTTADWRLGLPTLTTPSLTLRETVARDSGPLTRLLSVPDASRFGIDTDDAISDHAVQHLIDRATRDRSVGLSVTYAITITASEEIVGLIQVRQLDPGFEAAEWEMTLAPTVRGTGIFLETARLVASFVFSTLGTHRIETRVLPQNGRAIGALRKLGAVQEGVLRRSLRCGGQYVDQVLWSILKDDWRGDPAAAVPRVH